MKIEHVQRYTGDPETVFAVLIDPDYVEAKCWATGATEAGVTVEPDGDSVVIRTVRSLPAKVPSYARSFVGDHIEVDQSETWGPSGADGVRDGTVEVSFAGTPMKIRGTLRLEGSGDGSTVTTSGDIKAGVPFVGGKLEGFAAEQVVRGLDAEADAANERLA